jgi:hypothetical protein
MTRAAVSAIAEWLRDDTGPEPARAQLAALAPGSAVEVRVPPFVAVQCISGPAHRRGNPPNVVEADPRTWLLLATGLLDMAGATASGALRLSGARAGEVGAWLPVVGLDG